VAGARNALADGGRNTGLRPTALRLWQPRPIGVRDQVQPVGVAAGQVAGRVLRSLTRLQGTAATAHVNSVTLISLDENIRNMIGRYTLPNVRCEFAVGLAAQSWMLSFGAHEHALVDIRFHRQPPPGAWRPGAIPGLQDKDCSPAIDSPDKHSPAPPRIISKRYGPAQTRRRYVDSGVAPRIR
jgi:hypothetical protein